MKNHDGGYNRYDNPWFVVPDGWPECYYQHRSWETQSYHDGEPPQPFIWYYPQYLFFTKAHKQVNKRYLYNNKRMLENKLSDVLIMHRLMHIIWMHILWLYYSPQQGCRWRASNHRHRLSAWRSRTPGLWSSYFARWENPIELKALTMHSCRLLWLPWLLENNQENQGHFFVWVTLVIFFLSIHQRILVTLV